MQPEILNPQSIAVVLFLAILVERLVEYFAVPIFTALGIARSWLLYVALITGLLIGIPARISIFAPGLFGDTLGVIITAILIGGGSNLIHDLTTRTQPAHKSPA